MNTKNLTPDQKRAAAAALVASARFCLAELGPVLTRLDDENIGVVLDGLVVVSRSLEMTATAALVAFGETP